ncbi:hypothetical protein BH20ACI4_BH20ACI4_32190 [soil metagenome]
MKVCPQCRSVFGDDFVFCSSDGTVLVEENLLLPTESDDAEAETVIRRREPIIVDFNAPPETQTETVEMNYAVPPPSSQPIIVEKTNSKFYALFLLVGLLLGGGLVLATLLAAGIINRPTVANVAVQTQTNENKSQKPENKNDKSDTEIDKLADELHQKRDAGKPDEDFNGRVIAQNAYVRSAPRSSSDQVDILPVDDRIEIESRENGSSPWYFVTCEHGIGGWMHGNTIEFTDGNF